jgi:hypothetical protein
VTVLALLVLILTDHVWKTRHPGLVTGKLSDVAGPVLMPAVLGVGIGSARIAFGRREPVGRVTVFASAVVTGVGFVLVKSSPAAAAVASGRWSVVVGPSQIRAASPISPRRCGAHMVGACGSLSSPTKWMSNALLVMNRNVQSSSWVAPCCMTPPSGNQTKLPAG